MIPVPEKLTGSRMKLFFVSLGCDKNLVDSEKMLSLLSGEGYSITDDEKAADVIIINTCCFIDDAAQESIDTILEMASYKKEGNLKALIVTGCLAQRYQKQILEEIPEADAVVGVSSADRIVQAIKEALADQKVQFIEDESRTPVLSASRMVTTGGHYAFLKIAEGCDKHCTYCIIPSLRGSYRSVPMEDLVKEARILVDGGVKELILVAQETTLYGTDLYGEKRLHLLVRELSKIPDLKWIRLMYCYPEEIYDELIDEIAANPKVCHYLDIPIQHCNDEILKRMGRKTNSEEIIALVTKLRDKVPDICLRTSLITGFPGESDEQHEELMDFINEMEFDRLGVFAYSQEEGTPAARMEGQIPEDVKEKRRDDLMALQQEISADLNTEKIGRELTVMVEGRNVDEDVYVCRTYADAPDVDSYLFLKTPWELMSGDFINVTVTEAGEYDLIGIPAPDEE